MLPNFFSNLVGEQLAWVLAHWARKERQLLARRENLIVLDVRTGFFSNPEYSLVSNNFHTNMTFIFLTCFRMLLVLKSDVQKCS